MSKVKVAILFGGKSSEYGVSLHSTASVLYNSGFAAKSRRKWFADC